MAEPQLCQHLSSHEALKKAYDIDLQALFDLLIVSFTARDTELNKLQIHNTDLISHTRDLENQIKLQESNLQNARLELQLEQMRSSTSLSLGTFKTAKSFKLPDPDLYEGDRDKIHDWVNKMKSKLRGNADHFLNELGKVQYILYRLGSNLFNLLSQKVETSGLFQGCDTAEKMLDHMIQMFGNPERERKALDKVSNYRQGKMPFLEWYINWNSQAVIAGLDAAAQFHNLQRLVCEELKIELTRIIVQPRTLEEFVSTCSILDSRFRALNHARMFNAQPIAKLSTQSSVPKTAASYFTAVTAPMTPTTFQGSDVINLSSIKRGLLSDAKKDRRKKADLYLYCDVHPFVKSVQCPKLPKPRLTFHNFASTISLQSAFSESISKSDVSTP